MRLALLAMIAGCVVAPGHLAARIQNFDIEVPFAPAPVPVGDALQLVYELHLTSYARDSMTLMSVGVLDDASGRVLAEFNGITLAALVGRPGEPDSASRLVIAPGTRAIIYFNLPVNETETPGGLRHRVEFQAGRERTAMEGGAVRIEEGRLPELGPPLRGGPWVAVHHPSWERGHRRVFYAIDGQARIPGRFAIDWMMPAADGDSVPADPRGVEVLAVADGIVAATRDGMPEPAACPGPSPASIQDHSGNHIVLELGGGRYAFYEHLKPGLRVKPGDRVRRGQVIGAVGCTGSVTRPHLHFHVGDMKSPLGTEGVPWVLTDFRVIGVYGSMEAFRRGGEWQASEDKAPSGASFPAPLMVVRFPEGTVR